MRRFTRPWLCALLCTFCCACADDRAALTVSTGTPNEDDDAGPLDTMKPSEAARKDAAVWPGAELELAVPFRGGEVSSDLSVDADLSELDVHINVDTTASFGEEIDALQTALRGEIVSALAARVPRVAFGVSRFADFPVEPFGDPHAHGSGDRPFVLLTPITGDLSRITGAVTRLDNPLDHGADGPEAGAEALYQIATGEGYTSAGVTHIAAWDRVAAHGGGMLGGVGFRPQALRVVLHVTDAAAHTPAEYAARGLLGTHDMSEAATALNALAVRTIAIMSTGCGDAACRSGHRYSSLRAELSDLALQTRAVMVPTEGLCPTGIEGDLLPTYLDTCPLVFDVRSDGTGLAKTVVDAVLGLLDRLRFGEVHAEVGDDPLGLVRGIEAISVPQRAGIPAPRRVDRLPSGKPDGRDDTFLAVQRRARLGFRITLRNDRLPPSDVPQRFRVSVRVVGDGVQVEERTLRIVVPAGTRGETAADASMTDAAPMSGDDAGY